MAVLPTRDDFDLDLREGFASWLLLSVSAVDLIDVVINCEVPVFLLLFFLGLCSE